MAKERHRPVEGGHPGGPVAAVEGDRCRPVRVGPPRGLGHRSPVELTQGSLRGNRTSQNARRWGGHRLGTGFAALAAVGLSACGGGAGGDTAQFCDEAADRIGAFREAGGEVSPTIIGTLRELASEAPDALTDDFETVTEASSDQEMDRALDNIEAFLAEECGLEVRA